MYIVSKYATYCGYCAQRTCNLCKEPSGLVATNGLQLRLSLVAYQQARDRQVTLRAAGETPQMWTGDRRRRVERPLHSVLRLHLLCLVGCDCQYYQLCPTRFGMGAQAETSAL